ncbi:hypothetical protein BV898_14014 [Hypsibius exemplaris]|uniref:Glycine zipper domain-containing protein n=1 Tax=Hypsibius exemplaris TaxID=2072580 RepID=A0A1W0W920_HYPEX|nr:hypothetical protein BV898_14014 [Hypsibius exemplaris]
MDFDSAFILFLSTMVMTASCLPVEVNREKRGLVSGGVKGALIGGIVGAVLPGVSAGKGAAIGAAGGAGLGALGNKRKTGSYFGAR